MPSTTAGRLGYPMVCQLPRRGPDRRVRGTAGVLVFHRTPAQAVQIGSIVEEAAQDAINAMAVGSPVDGRCRGVSEAVYGEGGTRRRLRQ